MQYTNVCRPECRTRMSRAQADQRLVCGQATQLPQVLVGASVGPCSKKKEQPGTKTRFYSLLNGIKIQNIQWYIQQI